MSVRGRTPRGMSYLPLADVNRKLGGFVVDVGVAQQARREPSGDQRLAGVRPERHPFPERARRRYSHKSRELPPRDHCFETGRITLDTSIMWYSVASSVIMIASGLPVVGRT